MLFFWMKNGVGIYIDCAGKKSMELTVVGWAHITSASTFTKVCTDKNVKRRRLQVVSPKKFKCNNVRFSLVVYTYKYTCELRFREALYPPNIYIYICLPPLHRLRRYFFSSRRNPGYLFTNRIQDFPLSGSKWT